MNKGLNTFSKQVLKITKRNFCTEKINQNILNFSPFYSWTELHNDHFTLGFEAVALGIRYGTSKPFTPPKTEWIRFEGDPADMAQVLKDYRRKSQE
jgi:hypothetical protein